MARVDDWHDPGPRSHFLAEIVEPPNWRRVLLRLVGRWTALLALAAAVAALVVTVRWRLVDPEGPGRPLYWVHDHIILPAWGYGWTAIHPYGVIWITLLAVVALLAMVGWMVRFAPVRTLQQRLTLAMVQRPRSRGWLIAWHQWARRFGLRPLLFEQIILHERRLAMDDLTAAAPDDPKQRATAVRRLATATVTSTTLLDRGGADPQAPLTAIRMLAETAVLLVMTGADAYGRTPDAEARALETIADALSTEVARSVGTEAFYVANLGMALDDFDWRRPAIEIAALLREAGDPPVDGVASIWSRSEVLRDIAEAVSRRLSVIETLRHSLERESERRLIQAGLPAEMIGVPDPVAARLSVLAALLLAHDLGAPHIALDVVEAMDDLALITAMSGDAEDDPRIAPLIETTKALTAMAIDTDIYRLTAQLAGQSASSLENLYREADDILSVGDHQHLQAQAGVYAQAAGRTVEANADPAGLRGAL